MSYHIDLGCLPARLGSSDSAVSVSASRPQSLFTGFGRPPSLCFGSPWVAPLSLLDCLGSTCGQQRDTLKEEPNPAGWGWRTGQAQGSPVRALTLCPCAPVPLHPSAACCGRAGLCRRNWENQLGRQMGWLCSHLPGFWLFVGCYLGPDWTGLSLGSTSGRAPSLLGWLAGGLATPRPGPHMQSSPGIQLHIQGVHQDTGRTRPPVPGPVLPRQPTLSFRPTTVAVQSALRPGDQEGCLQAGGGSVPAHICALELPCPGRWSCSVTHLAHIPHSWSRPPPISSPSSCDRIMCKESIFMYHKYILKQVRRKRKVECSFIL